MNSKRLLRIALAADKLSLRIGFSIIPNHYYSPVPDIIKLRKTMEVWARKSQLPGVKYDLDKQMALLKDMCDNYLHEVRGNPYYNEGTEKGFGPGYGYIEAQILHCFVRQFKPTRVIEVGSGVSTNCILHALEQNTLETGTDYSLTCIEPNPSKGFEYLKGKSSHLTHIREEVQKMEFRLFQALEPNDLLFIDSSHAVKVGSDVNFLILEVLPRLKPGVLVHFHDIFLPFDYNRDVLYTVFPWAETSLLHAFLINNDKVEILCSQSMLHYAKRDELVKALGEYRPQNDNEGLVDLGANNKDLEKHFPASTFLRIL